MPREQPTENIYSHFQTTALDSCVRSRYYAILLTMTLFLGDPPCPYSLISCHFKAILHHRKCNAMNPLVARRGLENVSITQKPLTSLPPSITTMKQSLMLRHRPFYQCQRSLLFNGLCTRKRKPNSYCKLISGTHHVREKSSCCFCFLPRTSFPPNMCVCVCVHS